MVLAVGLGTGEREQILPIKIEHLEQLCERVETWERSDKKYFFVKETHYTGKIPEIDGGIEIIGSRAFMFQGYLAKLFEGKRLVGSFEGIPDSSLNILYDKIEKKYEEQQEKTRKEIELGWSIS